MRKKDDEKLSWLVVGILFTGALIGVDIGYSSFSQMVDVLKLVVGGLHVLLVIGWAIAMVKFEDPNYDAARKLVVGICVVTALIVGIHHATIKEDDQILIDSGKSSITIDTAK